MAKVLVDTDIFIDHIRGARRIPTTLIGSYSVITRAELFAGSDRDELAVQALLAPHREIDVAREIADRAGQLRRIIAISLADALIAATALEHRLELVTRNVRDFVSVPGLRLRDRL